MSDLGGRDGCLPLYVRRTRSDAFYNLPIARSECRRSDLPRQCQRHGGSATYLHAGWPDIARSLAASEGKANDRTAVIDAFCGRCRTPLFKTDGEWCCSGCEAPMYGGMLDFPARAGGDGVCYGCGWEGSATSTRCPSCEPTHARARETVRPLRRARASARSR